MEYRILGKTGLRISRLGFGGIPIQKIDAEGTKNLLHSLKDAGVNYILEPFYPGTNWRADFSLICSKRIDVLPTEINCTAGTLRGISACEERFELQQVFVEITGKRGNEKYDKKLFKKREISKKLNIPLIFIDMTDYPNETGEAQTHLEYKERREVFQKLYEGYIAATGQFITPY